MYGPCQRPRTRPGPCVFAALPGTGGYCRAGDCRTVPASGKRHPSGPRQSARQGGGTGRCRGRRARGNGGAAVGMRVFSAGLPRHAQILHGVKYAVTGSRRPPSCCVPAGHAAGALHDPRKGGAPGQDRCLSFHAAHGGLVARCRRPGRRILRSMAERSLSFGRSPGGKEGHRCRETANTLCDKYN